MVAEFSRVWFGEEFRSAETLHERAGRLRRGLLAAGVRPDDIIALVARNSFLPIEVNLAASGASIRVVAVNYRSTPRELEYLLRDSGSKMLLGDADLVEAAGEVVGDVPVVTLRVGDTSVGEDYDRFLDAAPAREPVDLPAADSTMTSLFYTSGTTGSPKGVVRTAPTPDAVAKRRQILETCYGLRPFSRGLVTTPLCHMFGANFASTCLRQEGTVVVMPRFDAETFLRLVQEHRITNAQVVPTMLVRLLQLPDAVRRSYDISSLEHVLHTGAPCSRDVKEAIIEWFGPVLWEQYGSTETGVVALCDSEQWLHHPGTVGRAFLGSEIRIYADEGDVPARTAGAIYARMHGTPDFTYLGRPEARAAVERDGLINTGDIGFLDDDGYLYLLDRRSDLIITGGINVYPAEVEAELARHAAVNDAAVFGVTDSEYGQRVAAAVSLTPGYGPEVIEDIRAALTTGLSGYKVPREFFVVDELPRDDSGKLRRRLVREAYEGG